MCPVDTVHFSVLIMFYCFVHRKHLSSNWIISTGPFVSVHRTTLLSTKPSFQCLCTLILVFLFLCSSWLASMTAIVFCCGVCCKSWPSNAPYPCSILNMSHRHCCVLVTATSLGLHNYSPSPSSSSPVCWLCIFSCVSTTHFVRWIIAIYFNKFFIFASSFALLSQYMAISCHCLFVLQ